MFCEKLAIIEKELEIYDIPKDYMFKLHKFLNSLNKFKRHNISLEEFIIDFSLDNGKAKLLFVIAENNGLLNLRRYIYHCGENYELSSTDLANRKFYCEDCDDEIGFEESDILIYYDLLETPTICQNYNTDIE